MNKAYLIVLLFINCALYSSGQIAELKVDKKHSVQIKPCIANGSLEIPEGYYDSGDTIYFIVVPKGDWEFSKGDIKSLQTIQIKQSENFISTAGFKEFINTSKKTEKVLISFERKRIIFTDQFTFIVDEFTSDMMEFPEHFWPYYSDFSLYYNLGKQLIEQQKYIEAFQQLKNLLPGADHSAEYARFSNYQLAFNKYIPETVTAYQKKQTEGLKSLWKEYENNGQITAEKLESIKLNRDSLILMQNIFEPYFILTEPIIQDFNDQQQNLIKDYNDLYKSAHSLWKKSVLKTIENGNYEDGNKYQVYVELLARLLIYTNHLQKLSKYDSIDVSLISTKSKQVPFLKKYIDVLEKMQWKEDFITIISLMNDDIELNSTLIGQTHLLNLRGNKETETQPNYYIISGFNELVKGNFESFIENINQAIAKCTDLEFMYFLELWNFSYQFKEFDTDENLIETINNGLDYEKRGMPKEALEQYEIAERIGGCALPSFLIGMINLNIRKEIFSTERFLNDAINIYPGFALANIYHIKILIDSRQLELARAKTEEILVKPELSLWYIYFLQSKILFQEHDYETSLHVMQTKCRPLNPYSFEQYIMLGDIYLFQKNCISAKESFQSAGKLQPNNRTYSMKMQMLISQCK